MDPAPSRPIDAVFYVISRCYEREVEGCGDEERVGGGGVGCVGEMAPGVPVTSQDR